MLSLTAGGFLYIAGTSFSRELAQRVNLRQTSARFGAITLGVAVTRPLTLIAYP